MATRSETVPHSQRQSLVPRPHGIYRAWLRTIGLGGGPLVQASVRSTENRSEMLRVVDPLSDVPSFQ